MYGAGGWRPPAIIRLYLPFVILASVNHAFFKLIAPAAAANCAV